MNPSDLLLLCCLHLALLALLTGGAAAGRAALRRGRSGDWPRRLAIAANRHVGLAYDLATIGLGVAASLVVVTSPVDPFAGNMWVLAPVIVAGVGYPLLCFRLSGLVPRRVSPSPWAPSDVLRVVGCAAGEEVLWRVGAPAALLAAGAHWILAYAVAGAGFLLLHLPTAGLKRLPYHVPLTVLFTAAYLGGGVLSAVSCHVAHNAVLHSVSPVRKETAGTAIASRREW